jgi:hypothetical protein
VRTRIRDFPVGGWSCPFIESIARFIDQSIMIVSSREWYVDLEAKEKIISCASASCSSSLSTPTASAPWSSIHGGTWKPPWIGWASTNPALAVAVRTISYRSYIAKPDWKGGLEGGSGSMRGRGASSWGPSMAIWTLVSSLYLVRS